MPHQVDFHRKCCLFNNEDNNSHDPMLLYNVLCYCFDVRNPYRHKLHTRHLKMKQEENFSFDVIFCCYSWNRAEISKEGERTNEVNLGQLFNRWRELWDLKRFKLFLNWPPKQACFMCFIHLMHCETGNGCSSTTVIQLIHNLPYIIYRDV